MAITQRLQQQKFEMMMASLLFSATAVEFQGRNNNCNHHNNDNDENSHWDVAAVAVAVSAVTWALRARNQLNYMYISHLLTNYDIVHITRS